MEESTINKKLYEDMWQHVYQKTFGRKKRLRRFYQYAAVAAMITLVVCSVVQYYKHTFENRVFQCENNTNYDVFFLLPDSSEVRLYPQSKLDFEYDTKNKMRFVKMRGEAVFNVYKNPNMPFIVSVKNYQVKALGTIFYVNENKKSDDVEVKLIEGKISVTSLVTATRKAFPLVHPKILSTGQTCTLTEAIPFDSIHIKQQSYSNVVSQKSFVQPDFKVKYVDHNYLEFKNEKLTKVFQILSSIYHKDIQFNVKDTDQYYFTGNINQQDSLQSFVSNVARINHFRLILNNDKIIFY